MEPQQECPAAKWLSFTVAIAGEKISTAERGPELGRYRKAIDYRMVS